MSNELFLAIANGDVDTVRRLVGEDPSLASLRDTAVELEDCRVWACAAAVEATGMSREAVEARLDGVLSTPRFLREIGDARLVVV